MRERIFTYPSDVQTNCGFFVCKREIEAGAAFPIHWHDYYEFEILVSGRARHIHNNTESVVTSGCAYLMCYNDFHSLTALTDVVLYSVHFKKEVVSPKLTEHLEFHTFNCRFTPNETDEIVKKLSQTETEMSLGLPFHDIVIGNCLEDVLITLLRKQTPQLRRTTLPPPIHQAIIYLNQHYRSNITLEESAKKLSLSPNYFGQLFKAEVGMTFHQYLNSLRLKFACDLLSTSTLTVKEIAFSAGYNSLEYFMYIFKKHLSMTPVQYRTSRSDDR